MHWRGHWWGTEIVSDNQEDEALLKQIGAKLDRHALVTYEHGHFIMSDGPHTEFDPPGGFTLTFNR
jgi:hypothetical protein